MEYTKDYGKVGLTFEHYQQGKAVEELTLVAYQGELYVSLRGTVMNASIPTASEDWFKVSTFGDLLEAIRKVLADSNKLKADIEQIKKECEVILGAMRSTIETELQSIETRATAAISNINSTNNSVKSAENQRVEAENLRKQAETLRAQAEDARILAESLRSSNESKRAEQERDRVNAEATRNEEWAHMKTSITTTIQTANDAAARAVEAAQQVGVAIANANTAAQNANTEAAKIQPALDAMDATFQQKEAQRDAAVAEATIATRIIGTLSSLKTAVKTSIVDAVNWLFDKVTQISRHIGVYAKNQPVTLTPHATNKMLTAVNGMVSEVKQAGWGISRLTPEQFTFGDTVFLKMVDGAGRNLMVEGAVLFASEEEIRDAEGQVVSRRVTSLFKASNTDVPLSGEVLKDLGLKGMNLLISHPLAVSAVEIGRSGRGASMATLESNMRDEMERYSPKNARILSLTAGQAVAMEPGRKYGGVNAHSGQLLMSRPLCDADGAYEQGGVVIPSDGVENVSVTIDGMRGDVIGGNQMQTNKTVVETPAGKATEDNKTVLTNLSALSSWTRIFAHSKSCEPIVGHKYLTLWHTKTNFPPSEISAAVRYWNQSSGSATQQIITPIKEDGYVSCIINITQKVANGIGCINYNIYNYKGASDGMVEIYNDNACLDLTTLFPTPSGQQFVASLTNDTASVQRVLHRLGFFAYEEQID